MAGQLTIDTLKASSGVFASQNAMSGIAQAWVRFDGSVASPTIAAGFNVSSITKNATGDYTITYSTAMADANYAYECNGLWISSDPNSYISGVSPKSNNGGVNPVTASNIRICCAENTAGVNSNRDFTQVCVAIHR